MGQQQSAERKKKSKGISKLSLFSKGATNKQKQVEEVNSRQENFDNSSSKAANFFQKVWHRPKIQDNVDENKDNWQIFNGLENKEEAEVLKLSSFLEALNSYMPDGKLKNESCIVKSQMSAESIGQIDISGLYSGIHIGDNLTLQNVFDMIEGFKHGLSLHYKYVVQIISLAKTLFESSETLKKVVIAPADHLTIVGDLHGQLDDLLLIFRENGFPSETNPYVFNGDFVDRGTNSVEVAMILYSFHILYPQHVHINRGNHEERSITTIFGFLKECQLKYDSRLYDMFLESFRWLPIGTLVNRRILILHGGLSKYDLSLEDISSLPRWEFRLPIRVKSSGDTEADLFKHKQLTIISELLWSDPMPEDGVKYNPRGAGVFFGPDIAEKFLLDNDLQLLIRSHECVPQGFHWPYGDRGMVTTLFSASNYGGKANNFGSYMHIHSNEECSPSFFQYKAAIEQKDMSLTNLQSLFSLIIEHHDELLKAFQEIDYEKKGYISQFQWCKVMESSLDLPLNWETLQPLLTTLEKHGCIPYEDFLNRYHVSSQKNETNDINEGSINTSIARNERRDFFNSLYKHRSRLEALFRTLDCNGNGFISKDEFEQGVKLLNQHIPKELSPFNNSEELMELLEITEEKGLNINHFMELFRINARLTRHAKWQRAKKKVRAVTALKGTSQTSKVSNLCVSCKEITRKESEEVIHFNGVSIELGKQESKSDLNHSTKEGDVKNTLKLPKDKEEQENRKENTVNVLKENSVNDLKEKKENLVNDLKENSVIPSIPDVCFQEITR